MPSLRSIQRLAVHMMFLVASLVLVASPASAELGYLEYSVGLSIAPNQNLTGADPSGAGFGGRIESEPGYTVGVALGRRMIDLYGASLRAEIAVSYRSAEIESMAIRGEPSSGRGDLGLLAAMTNAYVDYDLDVGVIPYLGVGVGYGRLDVSGENINENLKINDEASVFVWSLMAGATIPFSDSVDFTGGYRYLATTDPELDARVATVGPRRLDSEYDVHEITLGMRIKF